MLFGKRKRAVRQILIVEDEPLVAFDNEQFLRAAGYDIIDTVDTVADALRALADNGPDLILADIALSDGSGVDVAHAAQGRGIPLLFVTGQCPIDAQALALGCLAKPYSQRTLLAAIEAVDDHLQGRKPKKPPPGLSLFE